MEPTREGFFARLGAIGQIIGVIVAVIGVAVAWYYAHNRAEVTAPSSLTVTTPAPVATPVTTPAPTPTAQPSPPRNGETGEPSPPPPPPFLLEFTLHEGEQRTFLEDQASAWINFTPVGSEDVPTLFLHTSKGTVPHLIVTDKDRTFPLRVAGKDYSVYLLSVHKATHTVSIRINRNKSHRGD
jgi:hypothetical protein